MVAPSLLHIAVILLTSAQGPSASRLKPADALFEESFTLIAGVRELSNGSVFVSDRSENRLVLVRPHSSKATSISRTGEGPLEYGRIGQVFAVRGDSTLFIDDGGRRWLLAHHDKMARTIPADRTPFKGSFALLKGADTLGHVLAAIAQANPVRPAPVDSLLLVRVTMNGLGWDTVAKLNSPFPPFAMQMGGIVGFRGTPENNRLVMAARSNADDAILFPDGGIVVVRRMSGRVEWHSPPGKQRDVMISTFQDSTPPPRGNDTPNALQEIPFTPGMIATSDGRLMILRRGLNSAGEAAYEIVDRRGGPNEILTVARKWRIVGFGARHVYVVAVDADGLQHLQRHPWP